MRVFTAFAALVTVAVLSITLVLSSLPTSSAATLSDRQPSVVETTATVPVYGAWICQRMPFLRPLCRG